MPRIKKKSSNRKIVISSILSRQNNRKMEEKVKYLNNDLKKVCEENLVDYLCHENIGLPCKTNYLLVMSTDEVI